MTKIINHCLKFFEENDYKKISPEFMCVLLYFINDNEKRSFDLIDLAQRIIF